jgi:hypothetical protein
MQEITMKITLSRTALALELALLLAVLLAAAAISLDQTSGWHPLRLVSTNAAATASVDDNANGVIDSAEKCTANDVCEMTRIKITGGSPGAGKVLKTDATGLASWQTADGVASGMIIQYDGTACPNGWAPLSIATGRSLVGLPSGGTTAGIVGAPLADLENRPVPTHTHTTPPSATYHAHTNNYNIDLYYNVSTGNFGEEPIRWYWLRSGGNSIQSPQYTTLPSFSTAIVSPAGNGDGTNAPYVQRIICVKI